MSGVVMILIAVLAVWMLACAWCGFYVRFLRFLAVLIAGLALNMVWMMTALDAKPFEPNAIMALAAAVLYAVSAFGGGYLVGRMVRQFRQSRAPDAQV